MKNRIKVTINGQVCTGTSGQTVLEIAEKNGIPETARIPIYPKLSAAVDAGLIELYEGPWLDQLTTSLLKDVED